MCWRRFSGVLKLTSKGRYLKHQKVLYRYLKHQKVDIWTTNVNLFLHASNTENRFHSTGIQSLPSLLHYEHDAIADHDTSRLISQSTNLWLFLTHSENTMNKSWMACLFYSNVGTPRGLWTPKKRTGELGSHCLLGLKNDMSRRGIGSKGITWHSLLEPEVTDQNHRDFAEKNHQKITPSFRTTDLFLDRTCGTFLFLLTFCGGEIGEFALQIHAAMKCEGLDAKIHRNSDPKK